MDARLATCRDLDDHPFGADGGLPVCVQRVGDRPRIVARRRRRGHGPAHRPRPEQPPTAPDDEGDQQEDQRGGKAGEADSDAAGHQRAPRGGEPCRPCRHRGRRLAARDGRPRGAVADHAERRDRVMAPRVDLGPGRADRLGVLGAAQRTGVEFGQRIGVRARRCDRLGVGLFDHRVAGGDVGAQSGVEVRDPVDHVTLLVDGEPPRMLADEAAVVGVALRPVRRHTRHRPVHRDLVRMQRVGAKRPAAGLHDRGRRGRRRQVDHPRHGPCIPSLAEQPSCADQAAGPAAVQGVGGRRQPPRGAGALQHDDALAGDRLVWQQFPQHGRLGPDAGARHHHRSRLGDPLVGDHRLEQPACRARLRFDHAVEVGGQRRRGGEVRQDEHPRVRVLPDGVGDDLRGGGRLRGAAAQHPVDERDPGLDPRLGQAVAHPWQQVADPPRERALLRLGGRQCLQPEVGYRQPVRERDVLTVPLEHVRVLGHVEVTGEREPDDGVADLGREVAEVPHLDPGQQRHVGVDARQFRDQLRGPHRPGVEPLVLARRRAGEPGEFRERCQVALGDQRGDARLVRDGAEQAVHPLGLGRRQ